MIGEFDLPSQHYLPANKFTWRPPPSFTGPRKYILADKIAQHYYSQYLVWQKETNDPLLARSNWWADNWEELGKYL